MIVNGELGTKRIIELHKTRSNEINNQIALDKAELEKIVATSYLTKNNFYAFNHSLSKMAVSYGYLIKGKAYVEEQIESVNFTCTCNAEGILYAGLTSGYCTIPCKFEYTTTDGMLHVVEREMGMVQIVMAMQNGQFGLKISQVVDHIRFESELFNPVFTVEYSYVYK